MPFGMGLCTFLHWIHIWCSHFCSGTLESLMEESGCALEHPKAAKFRSHVLSGEWEQVCWDTHTPLDENVEV